MCTYKVVVYYIRLAVKERQYFKKNYDIYGFNAKNTGRDYQSKVNIVSVMKE